jgi:hypothetical protein
MVLVGLQPGSSFFTHILTLTSYVVFPSWLALLQALATRYHFDRSVVENRVELLTEGAEANCM